MKYLKIKSLKSGEYVDADELILHACLQVLCDFVEDERAANTDWEAHPTSRRIWRDAERLYNWWKHERPQRAHPLDALADEDVPVMEFEPLPDAIGAEKLVLKTTPKFDEACKAADTIEQQWYLEDQQMLRTLLRIRRYLWT